MKVQALGKTHSGMVRENNEDRLLVDEKLGLFIVCDGVGGNLAGEVAAQMATALICSYLEEHKDLVEKFRAGKGKTPEILKFGHDMVNYASRKIYDRAQKDRSCANMGSTLTLALTLDESFLVCHIGDSRLYMCNSNGTFQMTDDHTLAHEMFVRGLIEDETQNKNKNILTRSLGMNPSSEVDCQIIEAFNGDRLILCSDGVSNYCSDINEIDQLAAKDDLGDCLEGLIDNALSQGGADNASAIIIDVIEVAAKKEGEDERLANDVISHFPLFCDLSYGQLMKLKSLMVLKTFTKGALVISEGETYKGLSIIAQGAVVSDNEFLDEGQCFGIRSLFIDVTSSDNKRASVDCKILYINKESFARFVSLYPRSGNKFYRNLIMNLIE